MKALGALALVVSLTAAYAIAGSHDASRDTNARARALSTAWKRLGGSLVASAVAGRDSNNGVGCIRYHLGTTAHVLWRFYCFDSQRRLVEVDDVIGHKISMLSVLPDGDMSPVKLGVRSWTRSLHLVDRILLVDAVTQGTQNAYGACRTALLTLKTAGGATRRALIADFGTVGTNCSQASSQLAAVILEARPIRTVAMAIGQLQSQLNRAVALAQFRMPRHVRPVRQIAEELALQQRADAAFTRVTNRADSARRTFLRDGA